MNKEAQARIKINKLLESAGWRFEADKTGPVNIQLEPGVKLSDLGDDFENAQKGFIDFLLLDKDGRALVVVEAKKESVDPLSAKEQARNYARNVSARFIILSNGNIHYFWDTLHGNPETISRFPTQESLTQYRSYIPNPNELANTAVDENYILTSQMASYAKDPAFLGEKTRADFLRKHGLAQMRPYQVQAMKALQAAAKEGKSRFLFEMATGTGKTLTSAAIIKLFLKSGNARRVLFLVDRIELEDQSYKAFRNYLKLDYKAVIYKDSRDSWQNAQIVVSTIQTFMAGDRYKKDFSPTDFELVISDEAHRSIGGNSRAVFEYFVGYKLGLTATPKDYLKGFDTEDDDTQREFERRQLLDTYKTFGCDAGEPTFRYDLLSGVKDGFLINPIVVDARTEVTTKLLSKDGYAVHTTTDEGEEIDKKYNARHYERKFFNEETNIAMAKAFLDNGLLDPVAHERGITLFGKGIVFCVSQAHAARVTNILNKLAMDRWPEYYSQSDFAMQVTSLVQTAQQMTIQFSNNNLNGKVKAPSGYESGKTRVCVTVGMMTTGYDCQDLLNIGLMRPVFSPADFVQIKGRGTRKHRFEYMDYENKEVYKKDKKTFKLFDFFATCEYFEKEFVYDEKLKLPVIKKVAEAELTVSEMGEVKESEYIDEQGNKVFKGKFDLKSDDRMESLQETEVSPEGMRIDREGFRRAVAEDVVGNEVLKTMWDNGDVEAAEEYTKRHILNRPSHFLNLDKIRKAFSLDRRVTIKEFLQVAFGQKEGFETKEELLESEWGKFQEEYSVDQVHYDPVKMLFKSYIVDEDVRKAIDEKTYGRLDESPVFSMEELLACNGYKETVPRYVKDYVPLTAFAE